MSSTILPMALPWIKTYPTYSNSLSIIQSHEETHDWILSSFLQIVCYGNDTLSFFDYNYKTCPFLTVERLSKKALPFLNIAIIDFLKIMIDLKRYVYLIINPKYIPSYNMNQDSRHNMLIYGYNEAENLFYIADHFKSGKYMFGNCSFAEMENAVTCLGIEDEGYLGFNGCIELLSYNNDFIRNKYELSIQRIKDSLKAYLKCECDPFWSIQDYRVERYGEKVIFIGLDCYHFIHKEIEKLISCDVHLPSFYLLYEHKEHLLRVIKRLNEMNYFLNGNSHITRLVELCNETKIALNFALKVRIKQDIRLIKQLHEKYDELLTLDKTTIALILKDIIPTTN